MLSEDSSKQLNSMENLLSWERTWIFNKFINSKKRILAFFTGNQYGKTASVSYNYVLRILGIHPVADKNVLYFECASRYCTNGHRLNGIPEDKACTECGEEVDKFSGHKFSIKTRPGNNVCPECGERVTIHKRVTRIFRFCAENLPGEKGNTGNDNDSSEVRNTQYPAFKKWLPSFLLKKDITARNSTMVIADPNNGFQFGFNEDGTPMVYEGGDIIVEFVSYNQSIAATAGVQRLSVWEDEEAPKDFHDEQIPRLVAENGDLIISLTPANYITWTYDEIFEKAQIIYKSEIIYNYLKREDDTIKRIEKTDSTKKIAVFQAAMDDNPTLSKNVIEEMFDSEDKDIIAIRRYGIFKQVSGKIFKDFNYNIHVISSEKYFPDGIFHEWLHARGIDFHAQTPWAMGFMSLSPDNEAFIWADMNISPEKYTVREISRENALMGKDYKFTLNLIDPYAAAMMKDTKSVLDDINKAFYEYKREGIGTGGYWHTWDTKGEKGRDSIRMRLKNSVKVGVPFNNTIVVDGITKKLPTLWILDTARTSAQWMKAWRWQEWANSRDKHIKEDKNIPEQKYSHLNMVYEAIFKHPSFRPKADSYYRHGTPRYFQGRA